MGRVVLWEAAISGAKNYEEESESDAPEPQICIPVVLQLVSHYTSTT